MDFRILKIDYKNDNCQFSEPLFFVEHWYNILCNILLVCSILLIAILPIPIIVDVISRQFLGFTFTGVTELETQGLVLITFAAMPFVTAIYGHIAIDMFFNSFSDSNKRRLFLFSSLLCGCTTLLLSWNAFLAAKDSIAYTLTLYLPERYFLAFCAFSLFLVSLGMFFQAIRYAIELSKNKDYFGLSLVIVSIIICFSLPFIYKASGIAISKLILGGIGFLILFLLLSLRVPIGIGLAFIGVTGLLTIMREPSAAWSLVAEVPYKEVANFVLVAVPMFMLMGELSSVSSISKDMFDCATKWLGRVPGGLACASVGGCAGFGAICGDSMTTVITMSSVALPQMKENNYAPSLATGALAAGGTLGILIPPSMGFIFYSIMTEVSVGKLFIAGIIPGILLTLIFIGIIVIQVKRNPQIAPAAPRFSRKEKINSLLGLIPMVILFIIVVGGILQGYFTPGEGGAVGAFFAFIYALARRQLSFSSFFSALYSTALMTGKVFVILVGVYVFGCFLATSRLPALLAQFVTSLDMNLYFVLAIVIFIYIILGCVMNIIPMMLLTLPSIYPTIQSLGVDGIWFGVITVIVMEMGMITPPIGLNVFTMSSLAPDIPMGTIFKGVMPFFLGMCLCVILVILFPPIATWLPGIL